MAEEEGEEKKGKARLKGILPPDQDFPTGPPPEAELGGKGRRKDGTRRGERGSRRGNGHLGPSRPSPYKS